MMSDLVSIYIPTKNRVGLLKRAVHSILSQTVRNIELIIVSDGSEDETCDYVRSINSDIKVQLIHNERSVGASAARNQAMRIATGKFITGLDDDDMFLPHRIESFLKEWNSLTALGQKFSCLFDRRVVNEGDAVHLYNLESTVSAERIVYSNEVGNQVFTTLENMTEAGLFDETMPAWQDWETWVRLIKKFGPAKNIHANTYVMDVSHEFERITAKSSDKIQQAARLFYAKHCEKDDRPGLLRSLGDYNQFRMTLHDVMVLLRSSDFRYGLRAVRRGKFTYSLSSTLTGAK